MIEKLYKKKLDEKKLKVIAGGRNLNKKVVSGVLSLLSFLPNVGAMGLTNSPPKLNTSNVASREKKQSAQPKDDTNQSCIKKHPYLAGIIGGGAAFVSIFHGYKSHLKRKLTRHLDDPLLFVIQEVMNGRLRNINARFGLKGSTPLMLAADCDHIDSMKFLVEHGAELNMHNSDGNTALHIATDKGYTEMVKALLGYKYTEINLQNNEGNIALHIATDKGYYAIIEVLVKHGANPNLQNNEDNTALHIATDKGYYAITEVLVKHGANPNLQNNEGNTALQIAHTKHCDKLIELLSGSNDNQKAI